MAAPVKGKFHSRCGRLVSLSPDRERASLDKYDAKNDAMVYSDHPLRDGQLFQVKLELTSVGLLVRGLSLIFCSISFLLLYNNTLVYVL